MTLTGTLAPSNEPITFDDFHCPAWGKEQVNTKRESTIEALYSKAIQK